MKYYKLYYYGQACVGDHNLKPMEIYRKAWWIKHYELWMEDGANGNWYWCNPSEVAISHMKSIDKREADLLTAFI